MGDGEWKIGEWGVENRGKGMVNGEWEMRMGNSH